MSTFRVVRAEQVIVSRGVVVCETDDPLEAESVCFRASPTSRVRIEGVHPSHDWKDGRCDLNLRAQGTAELCGDEAPVNDPVPVGRVLEVLAARPLTYRHEADLQAAISGRLAGAGIEHVREAQLGPGERIDLLTDEGVGIEVKVAGSWTAVTRQLLRYAHHDRVKALVLVSTQASHGQVPAELGGISVAVHSLIGQGL